jgi:hypothetical protein
MPWIKQNLVLLISGVVALGLIVAATLFLFSNMGRNKAAAEALNQQISEFHSLTGRTPFPSAENVKLTRAEEKRVRAYLEETRQILPKPVEPVTLNDREFKLLMENTVSSLQRRATNSGVFLPDPRYRFGFATQENMFQFSPGSTQRWLDQLEDITAICNILFDARIHALEAIRRVPVARDDQAAIGQMSLDFLSASAKTNGLIVSMPYEIVFRGFTEEVNSVMEGFLRANRFFIVKSVQIDPASGDLQQGYAGMLDGMSMTPRVTRRPQQPTRRPAGQSMEEMYGPGVGGFGTTQPTRRTPQQPVRQRTPGTTPALTTVLSEGPLQVTLLVDVVKVITEEQAQQAAEEALMEQPPGFEEQMYY